MNTYTLDWQKYSALARTAAAEGCVLLRNENQTLPIRENETVSVFGRIQLDYFKSGTGSGGKVNVPYVRNILDGLALYPSVHVYEPLLERYRSWVMEHPFDNGTGWGTEPWCQEEMKLDEAVVADAAAHSDLALIILGRTAGEDRDNSADEGSYHLTADEKDMIAKVCAAFPRTAVLLNVGNIIDMSWVEECSPSAILYVWQGGMEGGYGAADVLCGTISPCGKLSDTIAKHLSDYPSTRNFGSETANYYQEDIYVGYRYFETFAKDAVQYPFGFGLSYTDFELSVEPVEYETADLLTCTVSVAVKNTGSCAGKEVVQVYICPPQGKLGKPLRNLVGFAKTDSLQPGESETLHITFTADTFASYDDSGASGYKSCFVLESGEYVIYVGTDVRSASAAGSFIIEETEVVKQCEEALAPTASFERMRPACAAHACCDFDAAESLCDCNSGKSEQCTLTWEQVPQRTVDPAVRRIERLLSCMEYTGDKGYKLCDVQNQTVSMEEFLAQLTDEELAALVRGEGMCSPKVTPGTAAAYGGLSEALLRFGIPAACCSDGPSGIRMDCGTSAFSLPNGTLLACTFNLPLVTELFEMEGLELYSNKIDALLGPGINIHRSPLNGRNFEYHSEDPFLTGKMAQAQLIGISKYGSVGTMKHFSTNNQEYYRNFVDSIVSERALREIYLKPYELGVRSGCAHSIMTSYNPINGIQSAGNYDLNTTILRNEWGYTGMVMTDWWATMNDEGEKATKTNLAAMVRAQNDVYMVTADAFAYEDNIPAALASGTLTRGELVRNASNICNFLIDTPAMMRLNGTYLPVTHINQPKELSLMPEEALKYYDVPDCVDIPLEEYSTEGNTAFTIGTHFEKEGDYRFTLTASSKASELAQMSVTMRINTIILNIFTYQGSQPEPTEQAAEYVVRGTTQYFEFFFSQSGVKLHNLRIERIH